jgi:CelD/BcsL family acetyltransferase involved in cellulose biosynthesis
MAKLFWREVIERPRSQPVQETPLPIPFTASASVPLTFRLITDFDELQTWAPAWQELLPRSAAQEPMQAPEWLLTWWRTYGQSSGLTLKVGLFHDGAKLIGLAPLCARRHRHRGGVWMARLEFLGADMDELDGVCSEFLSVIVEAGYEDRLVDSLVRRLVRGEFGPWQELVFSAMNGAADMPDRLIGAFRAVGFRPAKRIITEAPYVSLPESWDDFLRGLSARKRRYLLKAWDAFEAWTGGAWQLRRATTLADLADGQTILHRLHNQRWQGGAGIEGMFSKPRFLQFHQQYMAQLFGAGALDLFWIDVRGAPVAISYQIRTPNKTYFYQGGRELAVPAAVRPGIVISMLAIQNAIAGGLREYDFLGGPAQYKLQFTKTSRPLVEVRVARACPAEWIRRGLDAAIGFGRKLRGAWLRGRTLFLIIFLALGNRTC